METKRESFFKKAPVALYMLFVFFSNFSTMTYFLTLYLGSSGYGIELVSLFFFSYQSSKFLFEIPAGRLADMYGRWQSGVAGLLLLGIFYLILAFNAGAFLLALGFFARGIGYSFLSGSIESIYIDSIDERDLMRYNVVERLVFYLSYAISAYLGGVFSDAYLYRAGMAVDGLCILIPISICMQIRRFDTPIKTSASSAGAPANPVFGVMELLGNKTVLSCYLMDLSQAFSFIGIEDYYSLVLQDAGYSAEVAGISIAVQLFVSSIFGFLAPMLISKLGDRKVFIYAAIGRLLVAIFMFVPGIPPALIPLLYVLQTMLYAVFAPIKYALFQRSVSPILRCTAISIQSQMVSLGGLLFFLFSGVLANRLQVSGILLYSLVLTSMVYIPALFCTIRGKQTGDCS